MQRFNYLFILILITSLWSSCREDLSFTPSEGNLEFSRDTVYLDTVFTNIGSSTYNLKVYNRSNENILIPSLRLAQGQNSMYRLNVDGLTGSGSVLGKEFENVELLAKDSMYIFIETTIDIQSLVSNQNQFLYTDAIQFGSGSDRQEVQLVTLVKDAVFIYPQRYIDDQTGETIIETLKIDLNGDGVPDETNIQGRFLEDEELNFTNEKPYVIYGYAAVNKDKILDIEAGARIHFHANSGLLITDGGSIKVKGQPSQDSELLEGEVIFAGDRLEPFYENIPGQWQTIWLLEGSINNEFNHTTIKNSAVGILADGNQTNPNKLKLTNSQIYNSSNFGILARASSLVAENVVINNCGQSAFAGTYGGSYHFTHSTLANYWSTSFRQFPAVYINNYIIDENNAIFTNALDQANFTNCIIFGNDNIEFIADKNEDEIFNFKFTNCLLQFDDINNDFTGELYDFNDPNYYLDILLNQDPKFFNPELNLFQIPHGSPADGFGIDAGNLTSDIIGTPRGTPPDLGAFESTVFPE
jgi:hypothetical protein